MNIVDIDISLLKVYDNNPRINYKSIDIVAESISSYGFVNPIVIDENNIIINGHTRYYAAKKLGLNTVPVIIVDNLTDEDKRKYRIIDNTSSENSKWDISKLIKEISDNNFSLESLYLKSDIARDINKCIEHKLDIDKKIDSNKLLNNILLNNNVNLNAYGNNNSIITKRIFYDDIPSVNIDHEYDSINFEGICLKYCNYDNIYDYYNNNNNCDNQIYDSIFCIVNNVVELNNVLKIIDIKNIYKYFIILNDTALLKEAILNSNIFNSFNINFIYNESSVSIIITNLNFNCSNNVFKFKKYNIINNKSRNFLMKNNELPYNLINDILLSYDTSDINNCIVYNTILGSIVFSLANIGIAGELVVNDKDMFNFLINRYNII